MELAIGVLLSPAMHTFWVGGEDRTGRRRGGMGEGQVVTSTAGPYPSPGAARFSAIESWQKVEESHYRKWGSFGGKGPFGDHCVHVTQAAQD